MRSPVSKVSVIIPVRNHARELDEQLRAVLAQAAEVQVEVLVADNGSRDHTVDLVRAYADRDPRVVLVDAAHRGGQAAARNIAVAASSGDALLFCDADDLVGEGWLEAHVMALQAADAAAGAFDFVALNGGQPEELSDYSAQHFAFLPAGLGANLAVRAAAFHAVGGFDETMRAGEDIDLCWRLQLAGYAFVSASRAVVAKRERVEPTARNRQQFQYGRHDAQLYRRYRSAGMPRNVALTVRTWSWLVLYAPAAVLSARYRATWSRAWFLRIGRLKGSWEQRVFYP